MWPYPKVIAHRGGGLLAPENTLAGICCGLFYGFHAIEFDVMLARDGVPVVIHDPELGRTVAGVGQVRDFSAKQLAAMDAGSWFGPAFAGEPVPTFEEVHQFCAQNRIWMNVEIKPAPGFEEQTGRTVAELTKRLCAADISSHVAGVNDASLPLFSSFSIEALRAARAAAPEIPRGYLVDAIPADWHERLLAVDALALHVNQEHLSAQQAQAVKATGFGLLCYTVNQPQRAREILAWGVDAFCTDRIDLIPADFS